MPGFFSSSKKTTGTSTTNQSAGQSSSSYGSTVPLLDENIAPLMPMIGDKATELMGLSPDQLVPNLNDQITSNIRRINDINLDPNYELLMGEQHQALNDAVRTPNAVTQGIGALRGPSNIKYDGTMVPDAEAGGAARDIGAQTIGAQQIGPINVTGADVLSNMSPYQESVIDTQNALINKNNAVQMAQAKSRLAGNKSFGDRSQLALNDLSYNQNLAQQATLANLANTGYQSAQQKALADAARALQVGQSNQSADLSAQQSNQSTNLSAQLANQAADIDYQRRVAEASRANQQAGLTKAAADLKAQTDVESLRQSGNIAAINAAQGQQGVQIQGAGLQSKLASDYENQRLAGAGAAIQAGEIEQDIAQRQANAPFTQLQNVAGIAYGAPQGQAGAQASEGSQTGTSTTVQQGKVTNNPSLFQNVVGAGSIIAGGFDRGGLVRRGYADGGALPEPEYRMGSPLSRSQIPGAFDNAYRDWYAGRVQSSDMGPAAAAPADAPRDAAPVDHSFTGMLTRFVNRMADSPLSQFGMGVLATPQSGLLPLSSGLQAVRAARMQDMMARQSKAQTGALEESTRQSKAYFDLLQQLREEDSGGGPVNGRTPIIPDISTMEFAPSGVDARSSGPGSQFSGSMTRGDDGESIGSVGAGRNVPLSLQWKLNQYNRIRLIPSMQNQASKIYESILQEMPKNMTLGRDGRFHFVPGYVKGQELESAAKARGEAPFKERQELLSRAGQAVKVGPNETVTTGAALLGIPGIGALASPGAAEAPSAAVTPPVTRPQGVGRPTPAPGARKEPEIQPEITDGDTGLIRNKDGSMSSFWNDMTKARMDDFEIARKTAIEEAEHAQESDTSIARMETAFKEMQQKGTQTGYFTPGLGQIAAMGKSLGIDTGKLGAGLPAADAVSDLQTANKVSKVIMGQILKQMFPQRITNVDIAVNQGIAPGPDIDAAANLNLIDQIKRQNAYDKLFADEILAVSPTNVKSALNFQNNFYKKFGYGPLAGTYFSQRGGRVSGRTFSGRLPTGIPAGSVDTGMVTRGGAHIYETPKGDKLVGPGPSP